MKVQFHRLLYMEVIFSRLHQVKIQFDLRLQVEILFSRLLQLEILIQLNPRRTTVVTTSHSGYPVVATTPSGTPVSTYYTRWNSYFPKHSNWKSNNLCYSKRNLFRAENTSLKSFFPNHSNLKSCYFNYLKWLQLKMTSASRTRFLWINCPWTIIFKFPIQCLTIRFIWWTFYYFRRY